MVRNVIIDTDPGVDDAMAIMMALEAHVKGQIIIKAFTLAFGNATIIDEHEQACTSAELLAKEVYREMGK